MVPFLVLLYLINYLDRVNVGFAALTMNADIGLSAAAYGLGAGLFFVGYILFEVPSNVMLHRVGARPWLASMMITWGSVASATAFVHDEISFYIVRVLLGIAEAGFFPGIILYLTYWFPRAQRARIVALFILAVPLSSIIGGPLSTWLIQNGDGALGFAHGWRFMFFVEGLPAILLGVVVLFLLPSTSRHARWLTRGESDALETTIAEEDARQVGDEVSTRSALTHPRVLALGAIYFGLIFGLYVLAFFLPQIIRGFQGQFQVAEFSLIEIGLLTAVPYIFASVAMVAWAQHSDRTGERALHVAVPALVGAAAIAAVIHMSSPLLVMVCVTVCAMGAFAAIPPFWQLPHTLLSGIGAAAGIALINSFGNLSGFLGPYMTGWLRGLSGDFRLGLWVVAGLMALAAIIALRFRSAPGLDPTPVTGRRPGTSQDRRES